MLENQIELRAFHYLPSSTDYRISSGQRRSIDEFLSVCLSLLFCQVPLLNIALGLKECLLFPIIYITEYEYIV